MRLVAHVAVHVLACNHKDVLTFPRRYRLTRREGFSRILHQRAQVNAWFAVHSERNSAGHARLGISVTKRVLPAATRRNQAKRLIRECFRRHARKGMGLDVVIRLRKPVGKDDFAQARATLSEMLGTTLAIK